MRGLRLTLHLSTGEPIELQVEDILYYSRFDTLEGDGQGSLVCTNNRKLSVIESPGQIYFLIHLAR